MDASCSLAIFTYIHCLQVATSLRHLKDDHEVIHIQEPYIEISPYPYTSSPGKISHITGVYVSTLFEWILLRPTRIR